MNLTKWGFNEEDKNEFFELGLLVDIFGEVISHHVCVCFVLIFTFQHVLLVI